MLILISIIMCSGSYLNIFLCFCPILEKLSSCNVVLFVLALAVGFEATVRIVDGERENNDISWAQPPPPQTACGGPSSTSG